MGDIAKKKTMDWFMSRQEFRTLLSRAGAAGSAVLFFAFILDVVGQGLGALSTDILLSLRDMFFNTLYLVFLALVISALWGIPAGIYLAEYAQDGKLTNWVRMAVETLFSLPSIVVGLFGYLVFIVMTGSQWNLMAGALSVSILTLPLMVSVTENALKDLPPEYTLGSLGLGASKWQTIWNVLLPACLPRIMTGLILAGGRGLRGCTGSRRFDVHRRDVHGHRLGQLGLQLHHLPFEPLPSRGNPGPPCVGHADRSPEPGCGEDRRGHFRHPDAGGGAVQRTGPVHQLETGKEDGGNCR